MRFERYFADRENKMKSAVTLFLILLFIFAVTFFLWSVLRYNKIMNEKREKEEYVKELTEQIEELEYLVQMPLDDKFKIRIAREKLGMCFPDEIIYYTDMD
jgi:cell division protein FtsB